MPSAKVFQILLLDEDFKLKLFDNESLVDFLEYKLTKNNQKINSNDIMLELYSDSTLIKEQFQIEVIDNPIYSGNYTDLITFSASIVECTHTYSNWEVTKEATCAENGIKARTCSICGNIETETIPILNEHKEENGVCIICGKNFAYWEDVTINNNGGFKDVSILKNTKDNIIIRAIPKSGSYERLWFPLEVETGSYYKLCFTENKTYVSGNDGKTNYENDSNQYIYGCTVVDNIDWNAQYNTSIAEDDKNSGYYWKEDFLDQNYQQYQTHDVCLTFKANSSTMYWIWEYANITNGITIDFNISNISIEKINYPTNEPYIDFTNTTFNEWKMEEITEESEIKFEYIKDTYITGATENELDIRIETGIGWEYFNIPIHGLQIGEWYTIDYKELTTNCTINDSNCYANFIQSNKQTASQQVITNTSTGNEINIIKGTEIKKQNSRQIKFQANSETMYWVWQCGGITNYDWARIQLCDVNITSL